MNLTKAVMDDYLAKAKPAKVRDDAAKGFYARFNGYGQADFIMRYRSPVSGKDTVFVIGSYGEGLRAITIQEARKRAISYRDDLDAGKDLQEAYVEKKREVENRKVVVQGFPGSVRLLVREHLRMVKSEVRLSTFKHKSISMNRLIDNLGDLPLSSIGRADILAVLDDIEKNHGKNSALAFIRYGSAFWNWALEEDKVHSLNPFSNMKRRKSRYKSRPKSRFLRDDELTQLITDYYPLFNEPIKRAIMVCLYTNCRPGMATRSTHSITKGLDWEEINWDRREWFIGEERMKAHNEHIVPLSDQFYNLLREWWEADGRPETGPITYAASDKTKYSLTTALSSALRKVGATYTPHDFRRTVSTHLMRMQCPPDVRKALRAHVDSSDIAGTYEHDDLYDQKLDWLQRWADKLDTLGFDNLDKRLKANRLQMGIVEN